MSRKGISMLRKAQKALEDSTLIKVLQSEIQHELSSPSPFQGNERCGSLGDFLVNWDAPGLQDVVLRRKCASGEDVAVSALLGQLLQDAEFLFPRLVAMKVCVKKPSLSSVLQFDCDVEEKVDGGSLFHIRSTSYLQSTACPRPSAYIGPEFWSLDDNLQDALKSYLESKGINEDLTDFLLLHLNRKEQAQYVEWLQKLKLLVQHKIVDSICLDFFCGKQ